MGTDSTTAATVSLPADGSSVSAARRFVTESLTGRATEDVVDSVVLAVSELVTNAVLHARTTVEVHVDVVGDLLRIDVADGSDVLPVIRDYGSLATTGRGLALVARLTDTLSVDRTATGKRVWFTMSLAQRDRGGPERPPERVVIDRTAAASVASAAAGIGPSLAVLEDVPVALWLAARQHHEAALREYALYQAPRLTGSFEAWNWFDAAMSAHAAIDTAIDEAVAARRSPPGSRRHAPGGSSERLATSVPSVVTAVLLVEPELPGKIIQLLDAFDQIELLASDDQLLLRPALPEIVAVRDWCCEQVITQANGGRSTPWQREAVPTTYALERPSVPLPAWDATGVSRSSEAVAAADDNNRVIAVSGPAARMLGWEPVDLIGRRVVTLLPHEDREAHIAGFTRHLTTGSSGLLGDHPAVRVLRRDGTPITVAVGVEAVGAAGRTVFVAHLRPAGEAPVGEGLAPVPPAADPPPTA